MIAALFLLAGTAASPDPLAPLAERPLPAARVIRRGEAITLQVRRGAMTIATPARALGDAVAGGRLRVMVTATRRTLDAVAEAPGLAALPAL